MALFTEVDQLKAELDELRPLSPEREARVLQKFRLDWNYNSNAIEGNSLTLGETRSLLLHGLTAAGKPIRDHLDIRGHNEAVLWLEEIVRDERPLTEQFIRSMHEMLLGEAYEVPAQTPDGQPTRKLIRPGQYKSGPNNVLTATGEMFYFATPEETPAKMTDLVDWYRREAEAAALHPVALATEFHYRFVRIHPFDDGNGRMSRLLMNLILLRHGYPMTVIKATDRNQYLAALAAADAGEIEPFFQFIGENVAASLQLMIRAARGESIDEPDDLDKKLALLKVQLTAPEPVADESEWNTNIQRTFVDLMLQPWLTNMVEQTNRFDFAFEKKIFSVQVFKLYQGQQQRQVSFKYESIEKIIDSLKNNFNSSILYNSIQFIITWNTFYKKTNFNINIIIEFEFTDKGFTVFGVANKFLKGYSLASRLNNTPLYQASYSKFLDEKIVTGINYQLANAMYELIAAEVA